MSVEIDGYSLIFSSTFNPVNEIFRMQNEVFDLVHDQNAEPLSTAVEIKNPDETILNEDIVMVDDATLICEEYDFLEGDDKKNTDLLDSNVDFFEEIENYICQDIQYDIIK